MKITVITVCWNSSATIEACLQSVFSQSYKDIEYIVIDGGSTDGTVEILQKYTDKISLLVSEPDSGIYDAMNKGLRRATGDYVGFLNSDDVYHSAESVAFIAQAAMSESKPEAIYGDLVYTDKHNVDNIIRYWRSGEFSQDKLRFGWMPPHPTLYVRKNLLQSLGGFDVQYRISADYDFILRFFLQAPRIVFYVPKIIVSMRLGGASNQSLRSLWKKSREDLRAIRNNRVGGLGVLMFKNLQKIPQFILLNKTLKHQ